MSKSKKRKKQTPMTGAERKARREEKMAYMMKQQRRVLISLVVFAILTVGMIAVLIGSFNTGTPDGYTMNQYQRLQSGMSYDSVVKMMHGKGEELESKDGKTSYIWENEDGSSITVTFKDDIVSSFNQDGIID